MTAVLSVPRQMVESVASLRFPAMSDRRLQALMGRNNDGRLSSEEQDEMASLVELSEAISLVRADALELLGRSPL